MRLCFFYVYPSSVSHTRNQALKCFDAPKVLGQILALNPPGPQNTCPTFLEVRRVHYELHVPNTCDPIYFGREWSQNLDKFANEVSRDILRNNVRVRDLEAMLDGLTRVWGHHDSGTARVVQAAIFAIMGMVNRYDQAVEVLLEYMDRHMDDSDEVGLWQKCSLVNQCSSRLFYTLRCLRIHTYGLDFHGDEAQKLLENIAAGAFGYSIVPGQVCLCFALYFVLLSLNFDFFVCLCFAFFYFVS